MFKRYRFVVALVLCLCVFAYDTVSISSDLGGMSFAWATEAPQPTFHATALELGGSLGLYFYLKDAVAGTMTFTINNDTEHQTIAFNGSATGNVDGVHKYTENNIEYWGFRCDTTSVQMADTITAKFKPTSGSEITNTLTVDSVTDYLTKLNPTADSKLAALVTAIKDYGHYAQVTLNETNTSYSSAGHTAMTTVLTEANAFTNIATNSVTGTTTVPITGSAQTGDPALSTYALSVKDGSGNAVTNSGVSLTLDLDSYTVLHVYLPSDIYSEGASATAAVQKVSDTKNNDNHITRGGYVNGTVSPAMTIAEEKVDSKTDLILSNISAHEIDNKYTITITKNSATAYTIEVSPLSYVYAVLGMTYDSDNTNNNPAGIDSSTELDHLKQAVIAFYNYYAKTIAYRTSSEYTVSSEN